MTSEKSEPKSNNQSSDTKRKSDEERLEEGLKESFPASDPVAASQTTRTGGPDETKKPAPKKK